MKRLLTYMVITVFILIGMVYLFSNEVVSHPDNQTNFYPDRAELLSQRWRYQDVLMIFGDQDLTSAVRYQKYAESQQGVLLGCLRLYRGK